DSVLQHRRLLHRSGRVRERWSRFLHLRRPAVHRIAVLAAGARHGSHPRTADRGRGQRGRAGGRRRTGHRVTGPLTTFSLVGRCDRTGQLGVVVSTADVGAGRMVTWARAGVGAVATQSWPSLYLAIDALRLMEGGTGAEEAMASVLASDPGRSVRQLGMVDRQ